MYRGINVHTNIGISRSLPTPSSPATPFVQSPSSQILPDTLATLQPSPSLHSNAPAYLLPPLQTPVALSASNIHVNSNTSIKAVPSPLAPRGSHGEGPAGTPKESYGERGPELNRTTKEAPSPIAEFVHTEPYTSSETQGTERVPQTSVDMIQQAHSPLWLPVEIHRRLLSSMNMPRLHLAEGGTSSASLLSDRLLDDVYKVNNGVSVSMGYQSFLNKVIDGTAAFVKSNP